MERRNFLLASVAAGASVWDASALIQRVPLVDMVRVVPPSQASVIPAEMARADTTSHYIYAVSEVVVPWKYFSPRQVRLAVVGERPVYAGQSAGTSAAKHLHAFEHPAPIEWEPYLMWDTPRIGNSALMVPEGTRFQLRVLVPRFRREAV